MERRETSYSRETRQAGPILSSPRDENICQPLCRKVRVFGRVERNSPVSQQPEPRPEAHCLRIGVISRISVFKRIPTRDSRLAKTFFTLSTRKSISQARWVITFAKKQWRFFFTTRLFTLLCCYIANVRKNRETVAIINS